jgi:hypothetical protein
VGVKRATRLVGDFWEAGLEVKFLRATRPANAADLEEDQARRGFSIGNLHDALNWVSRSAPDNDRSTRSERVSGSGFGIVTHPEVG